MCENKFMSGNLLSRYYSVLKLILLCVSKLPGRVEKSDLCFTFMDVKCRKVKEKSNISRVT